VASNERDPVIVCLQIKLNAKTMMCQEVEGEEGSPAPAARFAHTACCMNTASSEPAMLVFGGAGAEQDLSDVWLWQTT
jgi:hypothetical protein